MDILYGINPVTEAIKSQRRSIDYVAISRERSDRRMQSVIDACRAAGIAVRFVPREEINRLAATANHQGVVAVGRSKRYDDLDDVLARKRGEFTFLVLLDGVEDPHNLGAIIRTADSAGADGIVIPERRSASVTATVAKASAGASESLPIARVTNMARTVEQLKEHNVWVVGLDEGGDQTYDQVDYRMNCALVLGAEGSGLHDLVRKKCDFVVSIPMLGSVPSLNVSVAAGVVMYEIVRQRRGSSKPKAK